VIPIHPELQARLEAGATTLCWCWRVTRRDGRVFGFTDHDRAVSADGTAFEPSSGLSPAPVRAEAGAPARGAAFGALSSDRISPEDVDAGLWDGARVEILRADWREPALFWRAFTGEIAQVRRGPSGFTADLAGPGARLDRVIGRVFAKACDAELGDARCGVDLSDPAWRGTGTVSEAGDGVLAVTGMDGFVPGWFSCGRIVWSGGEARVAVHEPGRVELDGAARRAPQPGESFEIIAGCDGRAETCREKFGNFINFRGCPHMPGNDVLLRHAGSETRRDGGRR
jgi:uncharacterized phage protein (TIGR02218 family)